MQRNTDQEKKLNIETVLVLQGGGSLGAYECGVYKALYQKKIKFDILAGSSIGAINASIICAAQNESKDASSILADFWSELSEDRGTQVWPFLPIFGYNIPDKLMAYLSSLYSVMLGNNNAFIPRWFLWDTENYFPFRWNFLYDTAPLKRTLKKYINFKALEKQTQNKNDLARLIISATDVQKGQPVVFDNRKMDIDESMIVACAGYPFYGIKWTESKGKYLWDGSLLSNTPMLEVIHASPKYDKKYFIVDVFPRQQEELPTNMVEVWHRARDIIFMDKTDKNIEILREIEKYLALLKQLDETIKTLEVKSDTKTRDKIKELTATYQELIQRRGAVVKDVIRIGRRESMHYLLEDADFSSYRIKKLIDEGEKDALGELERRKNKEGESENEKKRIT